MEHIKRIASEFIHIARTTVKKRWWSGKKFRHPETGNRVEFKSLPIEEQRRLNALNKEKLAEKKEKNKLRLQKQKERILRKKERENKRKLREKTKKEKKKMTPESHPNFFTHTGKKLNTTRGLFPGVKVEINPQWNNESDNTYYVKQNNPNTGRPMHFYTEDYIKKHNKIKFANNQRFNALLPKIRKKYSEDLTSSDPRDRVYSTAVALVDQGAMRIGNKKSEENDVRGLHNLQKGHMKIDGNTVSLTYTGKKKVPQKHEFTVSDDIKNNLIELTKDKRDSDPIFTWDKNGEEIRIAPRYVNGYLRHKLGSNVTIHHFRHHHGTQIAQEYLNNIDPKKMNKSQVKQAVRDAAAEVSEYLGNTPNTARKHYIDPAVFQNFYARAGFDMKNAYSKNMNKTAKSKFTFNIAPMASLKPEEEEFGNSLWEMKLEDLQPYENINFD